MGDVGGGLVVDRAMSWLTIRRRLVVSRRLRGDYLVN